MPNLNQGWVGTISYGLARPVTNVRIPQRMSITDPFLSRSEPIGVNVICSSRFKHTRMIQTKPAAPRFSSYFWINHAPALSRCSRIWCHCQRCGCLGHTLLDLAKLHKNARCVRVPELRGPMWVPCISKPNTFYLFAEFCVSFIAHNWNGIFCPRGWTLISNMSSMQHMTFYMMLHLHHTALLCIILHCFIIL